MLPLIMPDLSGRRLPLFRGVRSMMKTGFLNGGFRLEKDGKAYALSVENTCSETVAFFTAGTYSVPVPDDTAAAAVALIGAGGAAGLGHAHSPNIITTYWGTAGSGGGGAWLKKHLSAEELSGVSVFSLTVGAGANAYRAKGGDTVLSAGDIVLTAGGGFGGNDGQGDGGSDAKAGAGGIASCVPESQSNVLFVNGNSGHDGVYPTGANPQGVYDGGAGQSMNAKTYGKGGMNGGYGIYNVPGTGSGQDGSAVIIFYREKR